MSPDPVNARPIKGLEFDHVMLAPATLLANGMLTASPGQNSLFVMAVTTGSGLIVTVRSNTSPEHAGVPPLIGVI